MGVIGVGGAESVVVGRGVDGRDKGYDGCEG